MPGTGSDPDSPSPEPLSDERARQLARRKLLKLGVYVAPAVLAAFVAEPAFAKSCFPGQCSPPGSCGPNGCPPVR